MVTTCRKSSLRVKPPVTSNHTLFQYVRIFSINVKIRASSIRSANFKSGLRSDHIFSSSGPIRSAKILRPEISDPNRIIRSAKSARMPFPGFDFVSRASSRRRDWREHNKIRLISIESILASIAQFRILIFSQYQINHNILATIIYRDI